MSSKSNDIPPGWREQLEGAIRYLLPVDGKPIVIAQGKDRDGGWAKCRVTLREPSGSTPGRNCATLAEALVVADQLLEDFHHRARLRPVA